LPAKPPELQAQALGAWLDAPVGTPPPQGLDPDALEAVYALRPDLAPAARVTVADILAEVRSGPLVAEGDTLAPVALVPATADVPEPANRSTWRRWMASGGSAMLVAAAALFAVMLDVPPADEFKAPMPTTESMPSPDVDGVAELPVDATLSEERQTKAAEPVEAPAVPKTELDSQPEPDRARSRAADKEAPEAEEAEEGDWFDDVPVEPPLIAIPTTVSPPPPAMVDSAVAGTAGLGAGGYKTPDTKSKKAEKRAEADDESEDLAADQVRSLDDDDMGHMAPAPQVEEVSVERRGPRIQLGMRKDGASAAPPMEEASGEEAKRVFDWMADIVAPASTGQPAAVVAAEHFLSAGDYRSAEEACRAGLALSAQRSASRRKLLELLETALDAQGELGVGAEAASEAAK